MFPFKGNAELGRIKGLEYPLRKVELKKTFKNLGLQRIIKRKKDGILKELSTAGNEIT
jgi:hypothetical protein